MKNKIIAPTDFTKTGDHAVKQAVAIAKKTGSSVTLFHVVDHQAASTGESAGKLQADAEYFRQNEGVTCDVLIREGKVIDMIHLAAREKDFDLMVIGTHGFSSLRQKLFGADILKLVAKVPMPVLVLQEGTQVVESFTKILLPVGSHENFQAAVEAVLFFAGLYDVEVHLYSIVKPGFEWPKQMLTNIEEAERIFEENDVRVIRIKEEQDDFSPGYARQTLRFARTIGADAIVIMSAASQEYYFMAKDYKETMLLNDDHLPVLCAGGEAGN
ncbi:MAG: universal stress protein [Bacteroidales bacterium]|nr:universal stress protein [Bacteroidales bacterium]